MSGAAGAEANQRASTNDLAICKNATDRSDALFATALGFDEVMEDIELYYARAMQTDFGK